MLFQILSIIGMTTGIVGTVLLAYARKVAFPIWFIGNIAWIIVGIHDKNWWFVAQFVFYSMMCYKGWIEWSKKGL